ncbi:hypothetical protein FA15DRAFT_698189 [Coprinopsis marcescibilis]|uniref:Uncharacterized protein n=1 Tax=Coprinopsis marcescibilis TaxID=230819 RepID=A0A5C3KDH7_COPMA|nr:hypothetical protein FA15DRAFT_698189 [Coprinopsis marcescibilis]
MLYWEPSTIQQASFLQKDCFLKNGRARALSLQLKPLCASNTTYSQFSHVAASPNLKSAFDALFLQTVVSPRYAQTAYVDYSPVSTPPAPLSAQADVSTFPSFPAPINALPQELLGLIFEEYLSPSYSEEDEYDFDSESPLTVSSDFKVSPLILSHVCRHWRATATSHKKLWSNIAVSIQNHSLGSSSRASGRNLLRLLRLFLARANGAPLSLQVAVSAGKDLPEYDDIPIVSQEEVALTSAVFKLLVPHAERWQDVKFQLLSKQVQATFLDLMSTSAPRTNSSAPLFPLLRSFVLDTSLSLFDLQGTQPIGEEDANATATLIYATILRNSPSLSDLVVDDELFEYLDSQLENDDLVVPWKSIKNLDISCNTIPAQRLLRICQKASNLETMSVWRVGDSDRMDVDDIRTRCHGVTLPRLRSANITSLCHPREFLSYFSLPVLETLDLDVQTLQSAWSRNTGKVSLEDLVTPIEELVTSSALSSPVIRCRVQERCLEVGQCLLRTGVKVDIKGLNTPVLVDVYKY